MGTNSFVAWILSSMTILLGRNISINFKHISSDIPSPNDLVSTVSFFLVQVAAMLAPLRGRENIYVHEIGQILQKEEEWRYIFLRILY